MKRRKSSRYLKNLNEELNASLKQLNIKSLNESLTHVEETFRDPNLLIESIQGIYLKQKKAVASIQSILDEMFQVKNNLKASNEFKPSLSFNKE